jgi:hypothetical protein
MFYTIHRTPSPRLVAAGRSGISLDEIEQRSEKWAKGSMLLLFDR